MEVNQIINGFIQKHQVHRMVSPKFLPFIPVTSRTEEIQLVGEIDEDKDAQRSSQ